MWQDGWNPNWDQSSLLSNEFLIDFHPRIINISQHANTSSDLSYLCKSRFQVKTKDIWLMHGHAKNVPRCSKCTRSKYSILARAPASALPHAKYADCAKKISAYQDRHFSQNPGEQSGWKLLKMSHLNFWILAFSTNFCLIKIDLSDNTVWP